MHEFTLKSREEDWMTLNIREHSFRIPVATSIPYEEARKMDTIDESIEFFKRYIDKDVAATLSLFDYYDIFEAWKEASKKSAKGVTLGES